MNYVCIFRSNRICEVWLDLWRFTCPKKISSLQLIKLAADVILNFSNGWHCSKYKEMFSGYLPISLSTHNLLEGFEGTFRLASIHRPNAKPKWERHSSTQVIQCCDQHSFSSTPLFLVVPIIVGSNKPLHPHWLPSWAQSALSYPAAHETFAKLPAGGHQCSMQSLLLQEECSNDAEHLPEGPVLRIPKLPTSVASGRVSGERLQTCITCGSTIDSLLRGWHHIIALHGRPVVLGAPAWQTPASSAWAEVREKQLIPRILHRSLLRLLLLGLPERAGRKTWNNQDGALSSVHTVWWSVWCSPNRAARPAQTFFRVIRCSHVLWNCRIRRSCSG